MKEMIRSGFIIMADVGSVELKVERLLARTQAETGLTDFVSPLSMPERRALIYAGETG